MYEMVVGLMIKNDEIYTQYREAMTPILKEYGGGFRYDFKVAKTLKNQEARDINRVFTIHFENHQKMENFFNNDKYLKIKEQFFEKSVSQTTIISEYERNSP